MEKVRKFLRQVTLAFGAGCFGAGVVGLVLWALRANHITWALGISTPSPVTHTWLYPRIVLGGAWGCLFVLPIMEKSLFLKGLVYSLGPMLVEWFVIQPMVEHHGVLGLEMGALAPVLIAVLSAVWGLSAAGWISITASGGSGGKSGKKR
jgi:hypothetical protein